jgi:tetratricopeptide (TPR) repeat protein
MRAKAVEGIQNPDTIGIGPIFTNFPTLPAMIGKIFLPVKMIALPSFESFSIITGIIFILILGAFLIKSKKIDKKKALFGVLWFSLFLFPSFLVRIVYVDDFFDYAEHRAYLPMIGILFILIEILIAYKINFNLKEIWAEKKLNIKKAYPLIIAILILVVLSIRSYAYQKNFKDRTAFWSHMVDLYPYKSRGYLDLGKAYFSKDDLTTAEKLYHMGIERNPNNKNLYIDLSVIYLKQNKLQKALEYAESATSIDPNDGIANYNLGKASYMLGQYDKAVMAYEKAVRGNGTYAQWYVDLGVSYYVTRQPEKSIQAYQTAIQLDPNFALAYSNMGASYAVMGKPQEAEQWWIKAISLEPRLYDAYLNLIRYYISLGLTDKAKSLALRLRDNGGTVPPEILAFLKL